MADAFVSGFRSRWTRALRSCASLGFIVLLAGAFWTGALWLARVMVHVAG